MIILSSYWKNDGQQSESDFALIAPNVKKFFAGQTPIKNFDIGLTVDQRTQINYSKGGRLEYCVNLKNRSFAYNNGVLIALTNLNWKDFDNQILNEATLSLLRN